jgi:hypothetical protein
MNTKRITAMTVTTAAFVTMIVIIMVACDNGQGMMHGTVSMGRDSWNWGQIILSAGVGLVIGFLLGMVVSRRK